MAKQQTKQVEWITDVCVKFNDGLISNIRCGNNSGQNYSEDGFKRSIELFKKHQQFLNSDDPYNTTSYSKQYITGITIIEGHEYLNA
ncbi:hypothetical protein Hokovirus_2_212 [Hokovirus HKV1]|uniref:Uncharacterized protein n=1 Tax=Hokovirus HKV1 TaxID=1977638 RepID=A0A1V0SG40_9VIRU|nr:hypothetical protein Hokovirus_2_212 [Hokovirus HKV1]